MSTVPKVIRDGKVAVLVSPGYGSGWSTWAPIEIRERVLFSPEVVGLVEAGRLAEVGVLCSELWPDFYARGVSSLRVEWVDIGTPFRVREYDGSEWIEYVGAAVDIWTA